MQSFVRGQRAKINQFCDGNAFQVRIAFQSARVPVFDFVCFGLDEREQLSDDRFMVFFNQKSAPGGAITLDELSGHKASFSIDLAALPPSVARLVFTASVDGAGAMRDLDGGVLKLFGASDSQNGLEYKFSGADFQNEGALMLAAIYRKDGDWRFWAQGQGFVGNLNALLHHFGGEEAESEEAKTEPEPIHNNTLPMVQPPHMSTHAAPKVQAPPVQPSPPESVPMAGSSPVVVPPIPTVVGSLQQTLAQASAGSTIVMPRGEHQGPIYLDKPLVLDGAGAVIWAQHGPVVVVQSVGVSLRDVEIEVTAPDASVPNSQIALWIAPGVGTQLHNVRARGEIIGVAAAEGEWKLPPFLNLGEFAPRMENRFQIEIETPHSCEMKSSILGVSLHPSQLGSGRQKVEIRVQNVASDTLLAGVLELSTGGIARTIPLSGRTSREPREAVNNLQLWMVESP